MRRQSVCADSVRCEVCELRVCALTGCLSNRCLGGVFVDGG